MVSVASLIWRKAGRGARRSGRAGCQSFRNASRPSGLFRARPTRCTVGGYLPALAALASSCSSHASATALATR